MRVGLNSLSKLEGFAERKFLFSAISLIDGFGHLVFINKLEVYVKQELEIFDLQGL
jgi:hypothetical protein